MNLPATELPAKGLVGQKCDLSDANLAPFNPRPTTSPALPFGYRNLPTLRKDKKVRWPENVLHTTKNWKIYATTVSYSIYCNQERRN